MCLKGSFEVLLDRVEALGVFKRNRKPLRVKVLSTLFYYAGLSYRVTAGFMGFEAEFSYEAVRQWRNRLEEAIPKPQPKYRPVVAVDETKLKRNGEQLYIWAAIDVEAKEILAFRASWTRSNLDALLFLQDVLKLCTNKPLILVDKGPWYPWALIQLGLPYRHVTFGMRNRIERWFGHLKARTKRFCNNFPHGSSLESIRVYLSAHIALYNYLTATTPTKKIESYNMPTFH